MSNWKRALALAATGVGALAAYNAVMGFRTPQPALRVGGFFGRYPAREGDLAYTVAGSGPALLLLHGLRPGDSMNEWREALPLLAKTHTVYALDLPGFGLSAGGRRPARAALSEAVAGFVRDIIEEACVLICADGTAPVAVHAARSLGSQVAGVVLVCPPPPLSEAEARISNLARNGPPSHTGAGTGANGAGQGGAVQRLLQGDVAVWRRAILEPLLSVPLLGRALLLLHFTPQRAERWARGHAFFDKERISAAWSAQHVTSARSAVLRGAGAASFAGALHWPWAEAWSALDVPCLLLWGRHAVADLHGGGLEAAPELLALRPETRLEVVDQTMLLPHVEQPAAFAAALGRWLHAQQIFPLS